MTAEEVRRLLDSCSALIREEDSHVSIGNAQSEEGHEDEAYEDDAVASVAYTVRALATAEPQEVAWAGRCAYEAADFFVTRKLGDEDEGAVSAHPIVQRELTRQRRDISDLSGAGHNLLAAANQLRERAISEGATFFDE
jgi:hypothetical protein